MAQTNFSRSNVNERTLSVSSPRRSSFDLSKRKKMTPQMGRLHPVMCEPLMPGSVCSGSLNPSFQLEKLLTPQMGRTRLDTHTFAVNFRRINKDFLKFVEYQGKTSQGMISSLPYFSPLDVSQILLMGILNGGSYSLFESGYQAGYSFPTRVYPNPSVALSTLSWSFEIESRMESYVGLFADAMPNAETSVLGDLGLSLFKTNYLAALIQFYSTHEDFTVFHIDGTSYSGNTFFSESTDIPYSNIVTAFGKGCYLYAAMFYYALAGSHYDVSQYGYHSDFFLDEYHRMLDLYDTYALPNTFCHGLTTPVIEVLKPYMGEGSNLDMLGYPIVRQYSAFYDFCASVTDSFDLLDTSQNFVSFDNGAFVLNNDSVPADPFYLFSNLVGFFRSFLYSNYSSTDSSLVVNYYGSDLALAGYGYQSSYRFRVNPVCGLRSFFDMRVDGGPVILFPITDLNYNLNYASDYVSEMPLRAVYACWYDRFRDWHIETKENCPNPDDFGNQSIIRVATPLGQSFSFSTFCCLAVPRYRYYSRDALTTIQTDDIYRHVYVPVMGDASVSSASLESSEVTTDVIDKITDVVIDSVSQAFPSGLFNPREFGRNSWIALRADLQNMRRTSMLEKWLARNYFYPDNFAGQIQAHWDVEPQDLNVLSADYIGGAETMISGEQQIANMTNEQTLAGTRTLVAGVDMSDSFSYRTYGDFCYIVSFVSVVPLVQYDSANMHLHELHYSDFPFPEYAEDTRVMIWLKDMLRGFDNNENLIGYVPRYYQYRTSLDEVHGRYLTDLRSYDWFRDWYNMNFVDSANPNQYKRGFSLSPYSMRVHLPLDCFVGLAPWDSIAYGSVDCRFEVNIPLPAAVEYI